MLLSSDGDSEVRDTAEQTLQALPADLHRGFHCPIRRADGAARILHQPRHLSRPSTPAPDFDEPLVDNSLENELGLEGNEDRSRRRSRSAWPR